MCCNNPTPITATHVLQNLSVLGLYVHINDSGLFAWIGLDILSRTCFTNDIWEGSIFIKVTAA